MTDRPDNDTSNDNTGTGAVGGSGTANGGTDTGTAQTGTAQKDPANWTTGDEPMTGPQKSYLETLSQQAGREAPPEDLSKADASRLIDELQEVTGRGQ
jgi:DUF3072 family protein